MVGFVLMAMAGILLIGRPVEGPSPRSLTPELFARIHDGQSRAQVDALFPKFRPVNLSQTVRVQATGGAGEPEVVETAWTECSSGGTYYLIEFRIRFKDGRVVGKEQKGL